MDEYKSNSHKSKEGQERAASDKKIEKVVSGKAKTKKKSEMSKFTDVFIAEDVDNVKSYILGDILLPTFKRTIVDIVTNTLDMIFYGEPRGNQSPNRTNASKVSYRSYYDSGNRRDRDRSSTTYRTRSGYSYDDVLLESRGEAEHVLRCMDDIVAEYGVLSVSDLYDLVGITGNYTDMKYGWTDIRNASIQRTREGYIIKMPKALPLD